jgi:hypothetical protein
MVYCCREVSMCVLFAFRFLRCSSLHKTVFTFSTWKLYNSSWCLFCTKKQDELWLPPRSYVKPKPCAHKINRSTLDAKKSHYRALQDVVPALKYSDWLRDGRTRSQSLSSARIMFSLLYSIQTGSGTHSASSILSYGYGGSFPVVNLPGCKADRSPPTSEYMNPFRHTTSWCDA